MLETDPIDLLLDDDGDLIVDEVSNDLTLSSGLDAVAQSARISCQLIRGEWFANLDDGIALLERDGVSANEAILGQKFSRARVIEAYREALLAADGVNSILSIGVEFDRATRTATVSWRLSTVFGDTPEDSLEVQS